MAARIEPAAGAPEAELLDLRRLSSADLNALIGEEVRDWRDLLAWDFSKSAELVQRFVDLHALNGFALMEDGEAAGYAYFVYEERKGLVGDLYVRRQSRTPDAESRLLDAALQALIAARVRRVESQLMMARSLRAGAPPGAQWLSTYARNFMMLELERAALSPARVRRRVYVEKWSEHYQEAAAQLISSAYAGHVDSDINDQYRSVSGARRFLFNIVQYPGCGAFFKPASFAAFEMETGRICGICLASLVASDCGHITQVCVSPWARGAGVGYELLRQSLEALAAFGCRRTSLTVTASNAGAVDLYERIGFRTVEKFSAYVWEGF